MAKIESIFTEISNSQRFQVFIDEVADTISTPWYRTRFPMAAPQMSLTYLSLLGGSSNVAAASIVARDSETPLRSREAITTLQGEIPAIRVMRSLSESQYRDFLTLQSLGISDSAKRQQMLQLIYGDVAYVIEAIDKRLDFIVAQGLSTGQIDITVGNNPDGIVTPAAVTLPGRNLSNVSVVWSDEDDADPLTDIEAIVDAGSANGVVFDKILMDRSLARKLIKTKWFNNAAIAAPVKNMAVLNEILESSGYPTIEVVNFAMPIEENGVNKTVNPWEVNNAVFVPAGNLGEIKNALAIEDQRPVEKVVYSKSNGKLISKWSQNEPFREWTKGEFNAIPSFDAMKSVYILQTESTG